MTAFLGYVASSQPFFDERGQNYHFLGLIVFFTPVIYVISGFRLYKIFGLICTLVKQVFRKTPLIGHSKTKIS